MKKITRPIAVPAAVMVFFLMAAVGVYFDVAPHAVAVKAGIGAVITYLIVSVAVRIFVNVMVESMIRKKMNEANQDNKVTTNE
jgi:tetrahydromethanopterin S-methyltransferase subunit E